MDIIILTGMSGAGKSEVAKYLEDLGYFCVDNMPPMLLPTLVETFLKGQGGEGFGISKLAFVVDIRSNDFLRGFGPAIAVLDQLQCLYQIIFLEASNQVLINRYRQTRRSHPLAAGIGLTEAITKERQMMMSIRARATHVIDTSMLAISALRSEIFQLVGSEHLSQGLTVLVESFGFKYGVPVDCDNIYDVRFLPNPFYQADLKLLSGKDEAIGEFLQTYPETATYLKQQVDLLLSILPFYAREGKARLVVGIGCTGGRHRSVYLTEKMGEQLVKAGYHTIVYHRDIEKDPRYTLSDL